MTARLYKTAILATLALASCNEITEEQLVHSEQVETIYATIKDFEYDKCEFTRTSISIEQDGPHYAWTVTDTIGIFPSEGRQVEFSMSSGAGSASAVFTGGGWGLKSTSTYAAYFPLIGQYYLDKSDIPVHYTGQVQEGDASTAHLGVYDYLAAPASEVKNGGVSFDFERLGCLVQIQLTVPSPTTIYSVTLKAENEAFAVKGKVDLTESSPRIYPVASSSEIMLEVKNVTTAESNQVATFYMMLPPTDLSGKTLKAVVSVENGSKEVSLASKNFQAGKAYALSATLGDDWISETDYVDLKFGMTGVATSYNTGNGSLSITYPSGSLPNVKVGNATVLPAEYGFDIRVIESVNTSGNTISMQTSQGNMSNLFRNTSFTLTTDASATRSAEDNVYTPTAYGYVDEAGKYHEVYNIENGTRAVYPIEQFKWGFERDYKGEVIYSGKAGTLSWDECKFSAGLKGTFTFDFGMKQISEVRAVGDLKKIEYKISGNMDMDMLLHYNYEYEYKESGDEIIQYNAIPMGQFTFRVPIGGVPVPVHLQIYTHLGRMYACHIEGKLDATAGVKMSNEVSIGLEWTPEDGTKPIREIKPTFEFHPLTVEAEASAEAKVSYYPQWEIGLYRFKAVWLEPRPYLKEKVEAGLRASTDGNTYCGWNAGTYCGLDIRMGLELDFGFWRKDVWTSEIYNCVKDRLLFNAPDSIRLVSPKENISVDKGENITTEFVVESYSPLTKKHYPCPFALVIFSTESGKIDKTIAIADMTGKVSVSWTPSPEGFQSLQTTGTETTSRILVAKVVDKNGKTINETNLTVNVKSEKPEEKNDSIRLREALIQLYHSTNGENWRQNYNWCSDKPLTEWFGIDYDATTKKYSLNLNYNNLTGAIKQTFPDCLSNLWLYSNLLTSIDVSGSRGLESLEIGDTYSTSMDSVIVSQCDNLVKFYISGRIQNLLTIGFIDISGTNIKEFHGHDLKVQNMIASDCTSLKHFSFLGDEEKEYVGNLNLSGCISLEDFACGHAKSVNLSGCSSLRECNLDFVYGGGVLEKLDIKGCVMLETLLVSGNLLTTLNVSGFTNLQSIDCENNKLTTLNITGCSALDWLNCSNNYLTTLNASGLTNLQSIECENNKLTALNITGCIALEELSCANNNLTSLDVSDCYRLEWLYCQDNKINSVIPDWFARLKHFSYDQRYYYRNKVVLVDQGYGWWYPGEPERGYHDQNDQ